MAEKIPSSEREPAAEVFRKLAATLGELRVAASAPPDAPKSWAKRAFNPSPASARQREFNVDLVHALTEMLNLVRATMNDQEMRLERLEVRADSENLDAFRERCDRLETELRSAAANVRALQERAAALETALAERIQQVLDEQRVCIRQLSLQASEEAVLSDRARRATELKLDELARRVPPPPA